MKKYDIGFVQGTFDMFHIGHLNLLKNAKMYCNTLIVGINKNELVEEYKHKAPIISVEERAEIVSQIKYVDQVVICDTRDKLKIWEKCKYNVLMMGDDWKNTDFYNDVEKDLKKINVDVVYFPYTKNISSTILREKIGDKNEK